MPTLHQSSPSLDQSEGSLPPRGRPLSVVSSSVDDGASNGGDSTASGGGNNLSMDDFEATSPTSSAAPARDDSGPARSSAPSAPPGNTDNAASAPASSDSASEAPASRASEASERAGDALPPGSVRAERAPTAPSAPDRTSAPLPVVSQQAQASEPSTELTPHEQQLLNKMAKDAREYATARFTELKQSTAENKALKVQIEQYHKNVMPASYYQNQEAYVLSPEYKAAATDLQYATYEEQHWTQQAQRIRAGESEVYDLDYDERGQPRLTKVAVDANNAPQLEVQLQKNIMAAVHAKQQLSHRVANIRDTHLQRYTQASENLGKLNAQYFKSYMDPKSPRVADINNFKQFLPAEFRDHPLTQPLAYSYAMVLDLTAKIKQLEVTASTKAANAADAARATPIVAAQAAPSAAVNNTLSMSMFND